MNQATKKPSLLRRGLELFGWTRSSSVLLGGFFLLCGLIVYVWWPLAQQAMATINWKEQWWLEMDWLLVGIFAFMSLTIMARADLRRDALIVFVGMVGGLVIEAWGTQTNLWHYYTAERPPLWIIPAWPIASLSIDRITRGMNWGVKRCFTTKVTKEHEGRTLGTSKTSDTFFFKVLYWLIFVSFFPLMLYFVAPTFGKSFTVLALVLVALLTLTPTDHRYAVLTFLAGAGLGYFLELWGTTRQCWTYYTAQTPPFFAVVAHGMAAVAFWRAGLMVKWMWGKLAEPVMKRLRNSPNLEV
jgi:cell division protein FtsW (lipid II flippase)